MGDHSPSMLIYLRHFAIALVFGLLIAIVPMGVGLLLPWFFVLVWTMYSAQPATSRGWAIVTQLVTVAVLVSAAIAAPVKTTEFVLDRTVIVLPKTKLTLAEMDRDKNFESVAEWMPRHIHMDALTVDTDQVIEFPARELSLREFVVTIENQSTLRHRFSHCGNGTTLLFGGDCCFGLYFR